eukprot:4225327-Amphidinium_carterae.1
MNACPQPFDLQRRDSTLDLAHTWQKEASSINWWASGGRRSTWVTPPQKNRPRQPVRGTSG